MSFRSSPRADHIVHAGNQLLSGGIDIFSSTALFLNQKVNGVILGSATGFLWLVRNKHYLVTNWHVMSGRNQENGQCIHAKGGIPDTLSVFFQNIDIEKPPIVIDVALRSDEKEEWIEHPIHGCNVDIAAIEIDVPRMEDANYFAINAVPQVELKQRVGHPVFIVGFPFGLQHQGFPVWKQGSFASEPVLSNISNACILVDSASRPGMSGAPVIQRVHGEVELENGQYGRVERGDGACRLVGVYSGRCHTNDPNDAQLGRVWPIRLVRELLNDVPPTLDRFLT